MPASHEKEERMWRLADGLPIRAHMAGGWRLNGNLRERGFSRGRQLLDRESVRKRLDRQCAEAREGRKCLEAPKARSVPLM